MYRGTKIPDDGHIEVTNMQKDVTFEVPDAADADHIDEPYCNKYRRPGAQYVNSVTTAEARSTTIKQVPREGTA